MTTLDPQATAWIVGIALVALIAFALWMNYRKQQSRRLHDQFGTEYERTVHEMGSRDKAEAELLARQKRVQKLTLVPLPAAEAERFNREWRALQSRFVDSPQGVLAEADRLVRDLMLRRGYPMGDFERRAADISVDHPQLVDHYRRAHEIALRTRGDAALPSTEDLRQAVIHYRALFDELLEVAPAGTSDHLDEPPLRRAA